VILDRYRAIQVVLLPIPDPLSLREALSPFFIGPRRPTRPRRNARGPAAEPRVRLYRLGLPGRRLSNPSCPLALTPLLSAPGARTPPQAPSYLPFTVVNFPPFLLRACSPPPTLDVNRASRAVSRSGNGPEVPPYSPARRRRSTEPQEPSRGRQLRGTLSFLSRSRLVSFSHLAVSVPSVVPAPSSSH
jgi:hypothetical protein